jgi:hypothetical protein
MEHCGLFIWRVDRPSVRFHLSLGCLGRVERFPKFYTEVIGARHPTNSGRNCFQVTG